MKMKRQYALDVNIYIYKVDNRSPFRLSVSISEESSHNSAEKNERRELEDREDRKETDYPSVG